MTTRRSCEASAGRCRGRSGSQTALAAHLRADPARRDVRGIEDEVLEVFAALLLELNAQDASTRGGSRLDYQGELRGTQ
jgi:hypothetical protein